MDSKPKVLATPEVGKSLGFEHYQLHPTDIPAFEKVGYIPPTPRVPIWKMELATVGREADVMDWFLVNWSQSIVYSVVYMLLIVAGQRLMKHRERFDLRWALIAWSGILAVYSIVSAFRATTHLFLTLYHDGFYDSVCNPNCFYGVSGFWALTFVISKVVELGDTAFIIFRKQPLIFLHWYHHVTVLCYSWFTYAHHAAPGRWFTIMNMVVHAVMYTYYTARAARFRVPRSIMMCVTTLQLSQMVVGLFVTIYAYYLKKQGVFCHFPTDNVFWAFAMYLSYFLLFLNYFYRTYIRPRTRPKPDANGAAVTNGELKNGVAHCNGTAEVKLTNGMSNGSESTHANGHLKKRM